MIFGVFAAIIFVVVNDPDYKNSYSASLEDCRILHTEFERSHDVWCGKTVVHYPDNWKTIVFNIELQKSYYLNFSQNPHLVNDSIYKFVVLH